MARGLRLAWLLALVVGTAADEGEAYDENAFLHLKEERPGRQAVIIDTDMDLDDIMAICYLLAAPSIEVKAITVSAVGWSRQFAGVVNAMRLTKFFGQPDIPVGYSSTYVPDTQLNLEMPNMLPRGSLLGGIDRFLTEYIPMEFNERPPSWMYAPRLISSILRSTRGQVDIIELGPLQAMARVLQDEPWLLKRKVRTFYMSGGLIQPRDSPPVPEIWPYKPNPNGTSYTGDPPGNVSWNIFSDPIAANAVFSYGLNVVLATKPFQTALTFATTDVDYIPAGCPTARADLLRDFITQVPNAANENITLIKYWDQSAAVLAVQMIEGGQAGATVCEKFDEKTASVMLEASDNNVTAGGQYARILESVYGRPMLQCLESNETEFKTVYFAGVCR